MRLVRFPIAGDNWPCKSRPFSALRDPNISKPTSTASNIRSTICSVHQRPFSSSAICKNWYKKISTAMTEFASHVELTIQRHYTFVALRRHRRWLHTRTPPFTGPIYMFEPRRSNSSNGAWSQYCVCRSMQSRGLVFTTPYYTNICTDLKHSNIWQKRVQNEEEYWWRPMLISKKLAGPSRAQSRYCWY